MIEKRYIVKTTNKINIARITSLVLGSIFLLSRFYEITYFYSLKLDTRKLELTLLDYLRIGLDLIPISVLLVFWAVFSLKIQKLYNFNTENKIIKSITGNFIVKFISRIINDFWLPELFVIFIFISYSVGYFDSVFFLIFLFASPLIIFSIHKKKIERLIKTKISYIHGLLIKFVLLLVVVFSTIGAFDGHSDLKLSKRELCTISLRTNSHLVSTGENEPKVIRGCLLKSFDRFTLFKIKGKTTIIDNFEILNIVR